MKTYYCAFGFVDSNLQIQTGVFTSNMSLKELNDREFDKVFRSVVAQSNLQPHDDSDMLFAQYDTLEKAEVERDKMLAHLNSIADRDRYEQN